MGRIIQVGNLSELVDDLVLRRLFEAHGNVRNATINTHVKTGRSTGVGFVEMASKDGGRAAIAALNHRKHLGCILSVCWRGTPSNDTANREQMCAPTNVLSARVNGTEHDQL